MRSRGAITAYLSQAWIAGQVTLSDREELDDSIGYGEPTPVARRLTVAFVSLALLGTSVAACGGTGTHVKERTVTNAKELRRSLNQVIRGLDELGGCAVFHHNPRTHEFTLKPCKHR